MNIEIMKEHMKERMLKHELRKRDMDGMMCYRCLKLTVCPDIQDVIEDEQFVISCSKFKGKSE